MGLAVGLNQLVPRLRSISPSTRSLLTRFVPFVAVASAGFVNIALMRWKEIKDGIDVFPPPMPKVESIQGQGSGRLEGSSEEDDAKSLGKSSKAGAVAVGQTAASRILTNMCVQANPFQSCTDWITLSAQTDINLTTRDNDHARETQSVQRT